METPQFSEEKSYLLNFSRHFHHLQQKISRNIFLEASPRSKVVTVDFCSVSPISGGLLARKMTRDPKIPVKASKKSTDISTGDLGLMIMTICTKCGVSTLENSVRNDCPGFFSNLPRTILWKHQTAPNVFGRNVGDDEDFLSALT